MINQTRSYTMFQELMPLLAQRVLVLTLSRVSSEEICLNVIPRPLKAGDKDENNALTTPLSLTGTPAELDQELPKQLVEFVGSHLQLSSTLQSAKAEMAAAAKTAKEALKKSAAAKPTNTFPSGRQQTKTLRHCRMLLRLKLRRLEVCLSLDPK
jgi:PRTRC genetic system protein E